MEERRLFGPPGTGKTTLLSKEIIPKAVAEFGSDRVMVTSFTKSAAREISSRGLTVDSNMVGTLHSLCYHALGQPKLYITCLRDWNNRYPRYALSGSGAGSLDDSADIMMVISSESEGSDLFGKLQILRAKMIPREKWHPNIKAFEERWNAWKDEMNVVDFTDLIDLAIKNLPIAPGNARCMIVDEAQDFTRQQIFLIRSWGKNMTWHLLCGDDLQTIFSFCGSDPMTFLYPPIPETSKHVLSQSWRVPAAVYRKALEISNRVKVQEPKIYYPKFDWEIGKAVEGAVIYGDGNYKNPEWAIKKAIEYEQAGKTVMFLTSCSYMLKEILALLKEKGIAFHNNYRKTRNDWNPLGTETDGINGAQLLHAFISKGETSEYWSVAQLLIWAKYIKVGPEGLIRNKGKKAIEALTKALADDLPGLHSTENVLSEIFMPEAIPKLLARNTDWLMTNLISARKKGLEYPLRIFARSGLNALEKEPKIFTGTIHSSKGGEAHAVFLYPDISYAAAREMDESSEHRDSIYRLFYVGATRAEDTLFIMEPATSNNRGYASAFIEI